MFLYENLISVVLILIPINILLILKISNKKTKAIYFDISIILILYLLYKIKKVNIIIYLLIYKIPYILTRIYNKKELSILVSIITILIYKLTYKINIFLLLIEYLIYIISPKNKLKYFIFIGLIINYLTLYNINIFELLFLIIQYIVIIKILKLYQKQILEIKKYNKIVETLTKETNKNISISKLTHELKNPLTVCNGYLEMIDLKKQQQTTKYINIIKDEISRSLTIINDVNNYGKLKKLELEEIDITYLLEETTKILKPLFENNNGQIILKTTSEIYLNADYNRLKQVFINLLKNTIEAKKDQENLLVEIKIKTTPTKIKIIIEDNGIGMSKENLNHLYEIFYTTKQTGTGLGVVYSKEVIELHGGTIKYESKLNKGTKVFIDIPKEQPI